MWTPAFFIPAKTCPRPLESARGAAGLRSDAGSPPRVLTRGAFQEPRPHLACRRKAHRTTPGKPARGASSSCPTAAKLDWRYRLGTPSGHTSGPNTPCVQVGPPGPQKGWICWLFGGGRAEFGGVELGQMPKVGPRLGRGRRSAERSLHRPCMVHSGDRSRDSHLRARRAPVAQLVRGRSARRIKGLPWIFGTGSGTPRGTTSCAEKWSLHHTGRRARNRTRPRVRGPNSVSVK